MPTFTKPIIVVSKCLEFAAVRHDGTKIASPIIRRLRPFVKFRPVCPEVEVGMSVPREPIRIVQTGYRRRLVQPATGEIYSADMRKFSRDFLTNLNGVDGFILKSRSPSCGVRDVKTYDSITSMTPSSRSSGFFATEILKSFPALAVEDENKLEDDDTLDFFLTKIYSLANCRNIHQKKSVSELTRFHRCNQLMYAAFNLKEQRFLNKILEASKRNPCDMLRSEYERHFHYLISKKPRYTSHLRVLEGIATSLADRMNRTTQKRAIEALVQYGKKKISLSSARTEIAKIAEYHGDDALNEQTYLNPYPSGLQ